MTDPQNSVFISYRRNVSAFIARAIFLDLRAHGFDVFMDVESIDSGEFDRIILRQIAARTHFVLILTRGTLERCDESGDWLRQEIEHAMDLKRNIIPVLVDGVKFDAELRPYLTGTLAELPRFNALELPHIYFDAAMQRLRTRFLKPPEYDVHIEPVPQNEIAIVERKIEQATTEPVQDDASLSVQERFNRGFTRQSQGDLEGAIVDYNAVISQEKRGLRGIWNTVFPSNWLALAYGNRGCVYQTQGMLDAALEDFNEALRLNPELAIIYNNRGFVYYHQGDYDAALDEIQRGLKRDPGNPDILDSQGQVYFAMGRYDEALESYRKTNDQQPGFNLAIAGLAITQHALGNLHEAYRLWEILLGMDERYRDLEWARETLSWAEPLVDEARDLIAGL